MHTPASPKWLPSHLVSNSAHEVGAAWPSALLAVVFLAAKKELAKNVCRPDTQNVAGHTEFIRGMEQAIGGGVRKAERGPKWYDL